MRNALANLIELPAIRQTPIVTLYAGLRRIDGDVLSSLTVIHFPTYLYASSSARLKWFSSNKLFKNSRVTRTSTNSRGGFSGGYGLGIEGSGVAGSVGALAISASAETESISSQFSSTILECPISLIWPCADIL